MLCCAACVFRLRIGLLNCEDDELYGQPLPAMLNQWLKLSAQATRVELVSFDAKAMHLPADRVWDR